MSVIHTGLPQKTAVTLAVLNIGAGLVLAGVAARTEQLWLWWAGLLVSAVACGVICGLGRVVLPAAVLLVCGSLAAYHAVALASDRSDSDIDGVLQVLGISLVSIVVIALGLTVYLAFREISRPAR